MRTFMWALAPVALSVVAACSGSGGPSREILESGFGGSFHDTLSARGAALADAGDCPEAVDYLTCAAQGGDGYEIAAERAGACYMEMAVDDPEGGGELRAEGLRWLSHAANAGEPRAQARLASEATTDGDFGDGAFWVLVHDANPRLTVYGVDHVDPRVRTSLQAGADADTLQSAAASAHSWRATPLNASSASARCSEFAAEFSGDRRRARRPRAVVPPQRTEPPGREGTY